MAFQYMSLGWRASDCRRRDTGTHISLCCAVERTQKGEKDDKPHPSLARSTPDTPLCSRSRHQSSRSTSRSTRLAGSGRCCRRPATSTRSDGRGLRGCEVMEARSVQLCRKGRSAQRTSMRRNVLSDLSQLPGLTIVERDLDSSDPSAPSGVWQGSKQNGFNP
jgi:hypothetical protein